MTRREAAAALLAAIAVGATACSGGGGAKSFRVQSCNMAPTLLPGYQVAVEAAKGKVRRADIVYFLPPAATRQGPDDLRVSRVVGMPGEDVEVRTNALFVNGAAANEPYLPAGTREYPLKPQHVPDGAYFLVGDNRVNSLDSRSFGPVQAQDVRYRSTKVTKGKAKSDDPDCLTGPGAPAGSG